MSTLGPRDAAGVSLMIGIALVRFVVRAQFPM